MTCSFVSTFPSSSCQFHFQWAIISCDFDIQLNPYSHLDEPASLSSATATAVLRAVHPLPLQNVPFNSHFRFIYKMQLHVTFGFVECKRWTLVETRDVDAAHRFALQPNRMFLIRVDVVNASASLIMTISLICFFFFSFFHFSSFFSMEPTKKLLLLLWLELAAAAEVLFRDITTEEKKQPTSGRDA